jgi:predicted enzyme involved in methoxymalonyl-ACP biosynthesis
LGTTFSALKKNLKKSFSNLATVKVALLGDSATQFLGQAIRGMGYEEGLDIELWEAEFDQVDRQTLDPNSELYESKAEIIVLFESSHTLLNKYNKLRAEQQADFANTQLVRIQQIRKSIAGQTNAKVVYFNYSEIDDAVFGNLSTITENAFLFQLRKLNFQLMEWAITSPNLYLCDISSIQNEIGKSRFFQASIYVNANMVLSIDALPLVAKRVTDLVKALQGNIKKCIILDLDNTTWGGIVCRQTKMNF